MKAILIISDGLGDRPVPELNGKTPLQAANTPNLDRMAKEGRSGLMDVIAPGVTPGSDTAHLTLFGYDPYQTYPGRGPLEALGAGLELKHGNVAFRANFATIDDNFIVKDRRAGRDISREEGHELEKAIDGLKIEDVTIHFKSTTEHRGALVLDGEGLSAKVSDIDPHEVGKKVLTAKALSPEAEKTARILNEFVKLAYERLKDLEVNKKRIERGRPPANAILLRGPGQYHTVPKLQDKYGIKAAVLAANALILGTALYAGMEHIKVEGQTGTIETNVDNIAKVALETLDKDYDFIFIHLKMTDNASHDHNPKEKIKAIEKLDYMVGKLLDGIDNKAVIAVTGDHSTPVTVGEHTCDPVPVVLWGKGLRSDDVDKFSEIDAAKGALLRFRGKDILPMLLGYAGITKKFGS